MGMEVCVFNPYHVPSAPPLVLGSGPDNAHDGLPNEAIPPLMEGGVEDDSVDSCACSAMGSQVA